jgi:hypothetical protein
VRPKKESSSDGRYWLAAPRSAKLLAMFLRAHLGQCHYDDRETRKRFQGPRRRLAEASVSRQQATEAGGNRDADKLSVLEILPAPACRYEYPCWRQAAT